MNIAIATKFDIPAMITLMKCYSSHSTIPALKNRHNENHILLLFTNIIAGQGRAFVAYEDSTPIGLLISIIQQNIWNPEVRLLHELAFYVEPEYQHRSVGYRLIKEYEKYGNQLVNCKVISGFTISRLPTSKFDPSSKGYDLIDQTYLKQVKGQE